MRQKIRVPGDLVDEFIAMVRQDSDLFEPGKLPDLAIRDKNDLEILSAALQGKSDLLVTGDEELLGLVKIENIEIVSPRKFWEKLRY